eukprot:6110746-Prymnesium_polylepis.2
MEPQPEGLEADAAQLRYEPLLVVRVDGQVGEQCSAPAKSCRGANEVWLEGANGLERGARVACRTLGVVVLPHHAAAKQHDHVERCARRSVAMRTRLSACSKPGHLMRPDGRRAPPMPPRASMS